MNSSEGDVWRDRIDLENVIDVWIELISNTILLIVIFSAAAVVILMRKRRDCFVLIVLTCYIISGIVRVYWYFCLMEYWDYKD